MIIFCGGAAEVVRALRAASIAFVCCADRAMKSFTLLLFLALSSAAKVACLYSAVPRTRKRVAMPP